MGKDKVDFEQVVKRGCGIDVHKEQLVATIKGIGIKQETRTYDCFTESLESLKKWLQENRITHVAMESTGVYWKPVYNIFEDCFVILLVNARHIKNVPGHKTDKKDSAWIAKLLLSGLLKGSFIPPKPIRELRDLTRYRKKIVAQIASEKNRLHRILEDANIKLSSVISNMSGATATRIINAMIDGEENTEELLKLIHAGVKSSKERLAASLHGSLTRHHKAMLRFIKQSIVDKERLIEELDEEIHQRLKDNELEADSELLQTIPGVGKAASIGIISEIGTDMDIFPDEKHLASWAGMCPGSNESAGKKKTPERPTEINT